MRSSCHCSNSCAIQCESTEKKVLCARKLQHKCVSDKKRRFPSRFLRNFPSTSRRKKRKFLLLSIIRAGKEKSVKAKQSNNHYDDDKGGTTNKPWHSIKLNRLAIMIKVEKLLSVCKVSRVIARSYRSGDLSRAYRNKFYFRKLNRMWKLTLLAHLRNNKLDRGLYLPAAILNISFCQKKQWSSVRTSGKFISSLNSTENWKTASSHVTEQKHRRGSFKFRFVFFSKNNSNLNFGTLIERENVAAFCVSSTFLANLASPLILRLAYEAPAFIPPLPPLSSSTTCFVLRAPTS